MQDMVYYFYFIFNCPHMEAYCKIVDFQELVGIPPALTSTVVRKDFPHQDIIRSQAQLSKRPVHKHPQNSNVSFCDEQVEIDILMVSLPPLCLGPMGAIVLSS